MICFKYISMLVLRTALLLTKKRELRKYRWEIGGKINDNKWLNRWKNRSLDGK